MGYFVNLGGGGNMGKGSDNSNGRQRLAPKVAIRYVVNPSKSVQLDAVRRNADDIRHIDNPSEAVQLAAVLNDGTVIRYIESPSETVQLAAVQQNCLAIKFIDTMPTPSVLRKAAEVLDASQPKAKTVVGNHTATLAAVTSGELSKPRRT
jgi:hypothetical protein